MPFFSVIIPTYNRGESIYPTLDSVLAQTVTDFELIVVDDGSQDSTPQVLEEYSARAKDARLRLLRRENGGTCAARNSGIEAANGQYIALLDHDDLWFPWTLESYRKVIDQFNSPSFCAGSVVAMDLRSLDMNAIGREPAQTRQFGDFLASPLRDCPIYPSGWAIRADVLRSIGGFFPYHLGFEDHDLMLRLGEAPGYVQLVEPKLAVRGLHDENLSSDRQVAWFVGGLEVLLERERNGTYPGGFARARRRRAFIGAAARPLSVACVRVGRLRSAAAIYLQTFAWHLRLGKLRYLIGFPFLVLLRIFRGNSSCRK